MRKEANFLLAIVLVSLLPTTAKGEDQMCQVQDPNDTYVNLRFPINGKILRSLPNGSWVWVDTYETEYDQKK